MSEYETSDKKPTKKIHTASRHPSKTAKPRTRPAPERDGFRSDVGPGAQVIKNWESGRDK